MIEVSNISKTYDKKNFVNKDISFTLKNGQIIGLIGRNGSGKTTLIRQLLKLIKPTEGKIIGNDLDKIAYVPQLPVFFPALTVRETISLNLRFGGLGKKTLSKRTDDIITALEMEKYANRYTYQLSGGMKKMMLIAVAFVSEKPYVILDEPTSMIDVKSKETVWSYIKNNKKDRAILLSSHDMSEVKELCTDILVLSGGRIKVTQSLQNDLSSTCVVKIHFQGEENKKTFPSLTEAVEYVKTFENNHNLMVSLEYPATIEEVLQHV